VLSASTAVLAQTMASSVSQHGITWYFDQEYEVGQYANGDWWVLGPVTITRITPESEEINDPDYGRRWINGTTLNPNGLSHGYDSSRGAYNHSLNVAPSAAGPLALSTGSVVSGISGNRTDTRDRLAIMDELSVLTVVDSVPPAGAFRPAPYGTDKTSYWTESQVDYSILQSLPVVDSAPSIEARDRQLRFWNEQAGNSWQGDQTRSQYAQSGGYGRNFARYLGDSLLLLHLDYTDKQKRDLYIAIIQYGLDIYHQADAGRTWDANGGINHGRKAPMILAGLALGDKAILYWGDRGNTRHRCSYGGGCYGYNQFQEDGQTFYVTQGDIDSSSYPQHYLGVAEYSVRYWQNYSEESDSASVLNGAPGGCSGSYRYVSSSFVSHGLAMRLVQGAVDAWNWQPFFDYIDRFAAFDPPCNTDGSTNGISHFARAMWDSYREHPVASAMPPSPEVPPASPTLVVE